MTFVAAFLSRETVWVVADRRLSTRKGIRTDTARKLLLVETRDGHAIFGYAGLGATAKGTEPSDWMSRVLRGRNLTIDQSIQAVAMAMEAEMPPHLRHTANAGQAAHTVVVAGFVGDRPRSYTIDLAVASDGAVHGLKCNSLFFEQELGVPTTLVLTGSGGQIAGRNHKRWSRPLRRLGKAHDKGKLSARAVADALAQLAQEIHLRDRLTGPNAVVAWRHRGGGGSHASYSKGKRTKSGAKLPTIARGRDMVAFLDKITPHMINEVTALLKGLPVPQLNVSALEAELSSLPTHPDEKLD